jgi:hypothetical protein
MTTNQEAIRRLFRINVDNAGNLPPMPGVSRLRRADRAQRRHGSRAGNGAMGHADAAQVP